MLYQRYSNPMMLLDQMLQAGQFDEFISELIEIRIDQNEKEINDMRWEYWLHRVFDMNFDEYVQACEQMNQPEEPDKVDIEATVKYSYEMMKNFHPE